MHGSDKLYGVADVADADGAASSPRDGYCRVSSVADRYRYIGAA